MVLSTPAEDRYTCGRDLIWIFQSMNVTRIKLLFITLAIVCLVMPALTPVLASQPDYLSPQLRQQVEELKQAYESKPTDKDNVGAKKPSQATLSTFLKKHTAQLHKIAADPRKSKKFDDFMARMAEDVQEAPKLKMPKTRNPVASHAQSSGSGVHADQNKKKQPMRKDKHKKQLDFATESIKEMLYRKLNAKK